MTWIHVETIYDLPQISDHNPMVLTLAASWKGRVPFRFFNVWATYEDFHQIVASIRNSSNNFGSLKTIWTKLKALKAPLKSLNAKDFKDITQRIEKTRLELKEIQEQLANIYSDGLLHKEKKTLLNLEKWSLIEESVLQQKVREKWIQLGDSNTKYFTAVMKERSQRKQIIEIINGLGDRVTDPAAIKREILGFYKALMQQKMELCVEVTDQEILESLKAIGDDKAPGIDGYNAVFSRSPGVMEDISFPTRFIKWIMECIKTVSYIVLVNGESTEPFGLLRDSDNEILSLLSSLQLGDLPSIVAMYQYFSQFFEASGLQANLGKSSVYFGGVKQKVKKQILDHLGFVQGELPFKYLGIPLSTKKIVLIQWKPLIDRITAKISSWTAKKLSYDGRVQLVQSVIFGFQAY
ncbi:uncharacterized protein LOC142165056 [Nicotiana tabacum]|uniref:Uncharacterized protein LOC142165056 n=1 Tax=Nicotiana tabacum TaxID=4097 RepID=A0AC58S485_TOBAC